MCGRYLFGSEFVFWQQRSQKTAGVNAVERSIERDVVLTGAWRIQRKLHPTSVSLGQTAILDSQLRGSHLQRRRKRTEISSINHERTRATGRQDRAS